MLVALFVGPALGVARGVRPHPSALDAGIAADLADESSLLNAGKPELARAKLEHALQLMHQIQAADFESSKSARTVSSEGAPMAASDFEALRSSVLDTLRKLQQTPSLHADATRVVKAHGALLKALASRGKRPPPGAVVGLRQLKEELQPLKAAALERRPRAAGGAKPAAEAFVEPDAERERERRREFETLRGSIRGFLQTLKKPAGEMPSELQTARVKATEWITAHRSLLDAISVKAHADELPSESEMASLRQMRASLAAAASPLRASLERDGQLDAAATAAELGPASAPGAGAEQPARGGAQREQQEEAAVAEAGRAAPHNDEARAIAALQAKYGSLPTAGTAVLREPAASSASSSREEAPIDDAVAAPPEEPSRAAAAPSLETSARPAQPDSSAAAAAAPRESAREAVRPNAAARAADMLADAMSELADEGGPSARETPSAARAVVGDEERSPADVAAADVTATPAAGGAEAREAATRQLHRLTASLSDGGDDDPRGGGAAQPLSFETAAEDVAAAAPKADAAYRADAAHLLSSLADSVDQLSL